MVEVVAELGGTSLSLFFSIALIDSVMVPPCCPLVRWNTSLFLVSVVVLAAMATVSTFRCEFLGKWFAAYGGFWSEPLGHPVGAFSYAVL